MPDHAHSEDPAVQAQLNRLTMLSPGRDVLGLERISALLERLGNPHHTLPPVFHVAGTNGKGSTCSFLRAAFEAAGLRVHIYSSPHLVRFNERIRVAGRLIDDATLAPLLADVLDCSQDIHPSFFEATTAAAFLAFARVAADVAIIEVGLGGRLDATNVITRPAVCGIAQLGIDHQSFLGETLIEIAGEKAGIAKAGVPLVTMDYGTDVAARVSELAERNRATWHPKGSDWNYTLFDNQFEYRDKQGKVLLPRPAMAGHYQVENAALAVAMIRHQSSVHISDAALFEGITRAKWPARLQKLAAGPLIGAREVWLDGGHNEAAGIAVAKHFRAALGTNARLQIIIGILANKDASSIMRHFVGLAERMIAVPVAAHPCHSPYDLAAIGADLGIGAAIASDLGEALNLCGDGPILILGSLYLAGEALAQNGETPR